QLKADAEITRHDLKRLQAVLVEGDEYGVRGELVRVGQLNERRLRRRRPGERRECQQGRRDPTALGQWHGVSLEEEGKKRPTRYRLVTDALGGGKTESRFGFHFRQQFFFAGWLAIHMPIRFRQNFYPRREQAFFVLSNVRCLVYPRQGPTE